MADQALWLSEADVVRAMSLPEAIEALEQGYLLQARDLAANMGKTHAVWGDGNTLHAIGATFAGAGYVGAKTWAHTHGGATPLLIMWDAETGALAAIIEAFALGQMRTGGVSGLATRRMAAPDAQTFAMIGAGKQALAQIAAVAAVRRLRKISVWSPTPHKREALAQAAEGFAESVVCAHTLREATADADIVTLATRAREPILAAKDIQPNAHINALGAITPERAELHGSVMGRATRFASDDPVACRRLSAEFRAHFGEVDGAWASVRRLADVIADTADAAPGLSIFKAMGAGVSDLALGVKILESARAQGAGAPIAAPARTAPRLKIAEAPR